MYNIYNSKNVICSTFLVFQQRNEFPRVDLKIARESVFQHIFLVGEIQCVTINLPMEFVKFLGIWVHMCASKYLCVCVCVSVRVCSGIWIYCQQTIVIKHLCWILFGQQQQLKEKENEVWTNRMSSESGSIFFSRLHTKSKKTTTKIHNTNTTVKCQSQICFTCWFLFCHFRIFFGFWRHECNMFHFHSLKVSLVKSTKMQTIIETPTMLYSMTVCFMMLNNKEKPSVKITFIKYKKETYSENIAFFSKKILRISIFCILSWGGKNTQNLIQI